MPVLSLYDFVRCDVRPRLVLRSVHWLMPSALGMVPHPKQCELLAAGRGSPSLADSRGPVSASVRGG